MAGVCSWRSDQIAMTVGRTNGSRLYSSVLVADERLEAFGGTVVAGSEVEDQIAAMRELLTNPDPEREVMVTGGGVVDNPANASSVGNSEPLDFISGTVVASQWYETNRDLQKTEIAAMLAFHPGATYNYLPDGRMYWSVAIRPKVLGKRKRTWTFLAVYDADHPQQRWGGSVKFYPVSPNYREMNELVRASSVTPKTIPHMLRDDDKQMYLCSQHKDLIKAGKQVTTAAGCLRNVIYWVNLFEWGLLDQAIWDEFHRHRPAH